MNNTPLVFQHHGQTFREQMAIDEPTSVMIRSVVNKGCSLYGTMSQILEFVDNNMRLSSSEWTYAVYLVTCLKQPPNI